MNDRLKRIYIDFEKAFINLENAAKGAKTDLEIDGTIKRFELCYELSWKLIKELLANLGIICKNPRNCFKQAVINDLIREEDVWLNMIDDRNELVHLYEFVKSREIFENIKNEYLEPLKWLLEKAKNYKMEVE
jgi:nucleotidyltransferase substrate binding protein (TIGR01987 family)